MTLGEKFALAAALLALSWLVLHRVGQSARVGEKFSGMVVALFAMVVAAWLVLASGMCR